MKKRIRKLVLSKETIGYLEDAALREAAGGTDPRCLSFCTLCDLCPMTSPVSVCEYCYVCRCNDVGTAAGADA